MAADEMADLPPRARRRVWRAIEQAGRACNTPLPHEGWIVAALLIALLLWGPR